MTTIDLDPCQRSTPESQGPGRDSLPPVQILFVTNIVPTRGTFGSQCVNYALLEFLVRSGCSVHVCCLQRFDHQSRITHDPAELGNWSTSYTGFHAVSPTEHQRLAKYRFMDLLRRAHSRAKRHLNLDLSRIGAKPFFSRLETMSSKLLCDPPDAMDIAHFGSCLERLRPDCVLVDYAWLTPLFELTESRPDRPLRALLTHDLIHKRVASLRSRSLPLDVPDWDASEEARQLGTADVLLVECPEDVMEFKKLALHARILVAPLALRPVDATDHEIPGRCLFVGGGAVHNVDGLRWFLKEVWPEVSRDVAGAHLSVCGTVGHRLRGEFENSGLKSVTFRGPVDSLTEEYSAAQVCVIPLLSGSGFKTKLIEALAYGKAIVSTCVGSQGIADDATCPVINADDPAEFARRLKSLLTNQDLKRSYSQRALDYVSLNLTPEHLYGPFLSLLHEKKSSSRVAGREN